MSKIRILFYSDDFKTAQWGSELEKNGCEVIPNATDQLKYFNNYFSNIFRHTRTIVKQFFKGERVNVFVFRYLNDSKYLRVALEYLIRDVLNIILCKLTNVKIIWIMHNVDRETIVHFPLITKIRRWLVRLVSKRILVTDPHLIDAALEHGVKKSRLDWLSFGRPSKMEVDDRNIQLSKQIQDFKNLLCKDGIQDVALGLCVSNKAKKKVHYLYADSIVGRSQERDDACVGLVMIGDYPEGDKFQMAKERVIDSPYILYIDDSFQVNESFISDKVDFIYRSMTDYSIAYTLYVACDVKKPVFSHDFGVLPRILKEENIGYTLNGKKDHPSTILSSLESWNSNGYERFLAQRNWKSGAEKLLINMYKSGIPCPISPGRKRLKGILRTAH